MKRRLRRQIRALQAYAGGASLALIALVSMGLAQSTAPQRIDEITVQRLNVVDANGTLRMVLSNKDRMHPGVMDGEDPSSSASAWGSAVLQRRWR